jgi:eukaryotic-like serine/threonine-protein kinase
MEPENWTRVKEVCLAALDRDQPERDEFLQEACGSDDGLRREVESLLLQTEYAAEFLESPPLELGVRLICEQHPELEKPALAGLDELVGKTVAHYRVLEKLGAGGMGTVYKAIDTDLQRPVALKFLSVGAVQRDSRAAARIEHEARAASALDHPNICTVYEVSEHQGHPFIAMQFLPGRTLKREIDGKPLPKNRIIDLGIQIADALEAAHAAGVIHRDITSANIVLTQRGEAKILDFGLAQVGLSAQDGADLLEEGGGASVSAAFRSPSPFDPGDPQPERQTQSLKAADLGKQVATLASSTIPTEVENRGRAAWGTASYMSPEQVLGEPLDARTDLFSFGVVLYEMATGELPFQGRTSSEIFNNILHRAPRPLSELNPTLGNGLTQIICKALRVDRQSRYQRASEMREDLEKLRTASAPGKSHALALSKPQLLGAALALLILATSAFYWFQRWRAPHLGQRDTLVLTDFNNATGDPVFDDALKQALRVQLEQSPFLNVLSDQKVAQQLRYMGRPRDSRLTPELAKDVCLRTSSKAMLIGSISGLGSHYVLGLNAVNCQDGGSLASMQAEAASRETVLQSLGNISRALRAKLGESLATISRYDSPVEQATTSSLEALRSYSQGIKVRFAEGDAAALPLFERATELDPSFAMAYARAAIGYFNLDKPERAAAALQRAFDLHDRVSERERLFIDSDYYMMGTGEMDKAIRVLQLWQQGYPREQTTYVDLAVMYAAVGQWEKSLEQSLAAMRLDSSNAIVYANLAVAYRSLSRLDESEKVLRQAQIRKLGGSILLPSLYHLAFLRGDAQDMQRQLAAAAGQPRFEALLLALQADTEAYYGRLASANQFTRRAVESALHHGEADAASGFTMVRALREAEFGNLHQARADLAAAIARRPEEAQSELAALVFARTGQSDRALAIAAELKRRQPLDTILNDYWVPTIQAAVELNRGHSAKAIDLLRVAEPYELGVEQVPTTGALFPAYIRGLAYLGDGKGQASAAEFQKILDHHSLMGNCPLGPLALLGLARAYAMEAGVRPTRSSNFLATQNSAGADPDSLSRAHQAYRQFLDLWNAADVNIPALKEAKDEFARTR